MNILCGDMTAADAINAANRSYASTKALADSAFTAATATDSSGSFDWSAFLADIIRPQLQNMPAATLPAPAKPSMAPYLVAGGAALLAIVALK